jgi:hypothetical protein
MRWVWLTVQIAFEKEKKKSRNVAGSRNIGKITSTENYNVNAVPTLHILERGGNSEFQL